MKEESTREGGLLGVLYCFFLINNEIIVENKNTRYPTWTLTDWQPYRIAVCSFEGGLHPKITLALNPMVLGLGLGFW